MNESLDLRNRILKMRESNNLVLDQVKSEAKNNNTNLEFINQKTRNNSNKEKEELFSTKDQIKYQNQKENTRYSGGNKKIVDTNLLTDNAGNFKIENTLTVNGSVYTAGAVQPQQLFSFESIDETGDMKIEYSKEALAQLSEVKEIWGTTQTSGSTVGSWVLVDAKTGKQMANPNNGHQGSIVCDLGTCGSSGSFGKEAAGFGGVYVLENLADPITGNVTQTKQNIFNRSLRHLSG